MTQRLANPTLGEHVAVHGDKHIVRGALNVGEITMRSARNFADLEQLGDVSRPAFFTEK